MQKYLVEAYESEAVDAPAAGRRVRAAAEQLSREGTPVRYVRTTLLPDDETSFHLFEAASQEIVADVCRRAGLASARIVPAAE